MNILPIIDSAIQYITYLKGQVKALIAVVNMKSYFILTVLLFGFMLRGQENFYFDQIGTSDGLSQSDVNCIYQDSYGYMWFGTHDGLNRYDGYSFSVFKPDQKSTNINSNLIYAMTGDDKGNLWIGSTGDGLFYYNKKKETFKQFKFDKENEHSISNDYITRLYLDSKNRLWIATKEDVNMVDLSVSIDSVKFQKFKFVTKDINDQKDGSVINSIYENADGELLLGGHLGIYKLTLDAQGKSYFKLISEDIGFGTESVGVIAQDRYNKLIVGTGQGLYVQGNEDNHEFIKIKEGNYTSLAFDDNNHIWAGTDNGLLYFDNSSSLKQPQLIKSFSYKPEDKNSISKNIITSLYIDRTGILWIGTNGGGVNKFDPNRKKFKHVKRNLKKNSLSYDKIRSIFEDSNGTLWVGTEGGGLNRSTANKEKYTSFSSTNELRKVFALEEITYKGRKFLLGGGQNYPYLFKIDITNPQNKTSRMSPLEGINRSVFSLLNDSQDNLWIGTYSGGIYRWIKDDNDNFIKQNFQENTSDVNSLSNNIVRNIYEDSKGNIWIATGDGLSQLTITEKYKEQPKFINYKTTEGNASSLSHNYILSLFESRKGELWIGTFGGGLNKLIPGKNGEKATFKSYSIEQGLPNNVIKAILEDEQGKLWVSTNKGLSMFDTEKEIFKNFDVADGLQDSEFQELAA
ncbi:MAG: two-component regulator propeller domain-containing protein, partial [Maribacter sp.]